MIQYFLHGVFEAFPISSSLHLMMFGYNSAHNALLHGITALVTFCIFHRLTFKLTRDFLCDIWNLCKVTIKSNRINQKSNCKLQKLHFFDKLHFKLLMIVLSKIVVGFLLRNQNFSISYLSFMNLIIFGILLTVVDLYSDESQQITEITVQNAAIIALCGLVSFLPGSSTLGIYYTALRLLNINKKEALDYAFILNIIPSLGAAVLKFQVAQLSIITSLICVISYSVSVLICRKLIKYLYFIGIYRVVIGIILCISTINTKFFYSLF